MEGPFGLHQLPDGTYVLIICTAEGLFQVPVTKVVDKQEVR